MSILTSKRLLAQTALLNAQVLERMLYNEARRRRAAGEYVDLLDEQLESRLATYLDQLIAQLNDLEAFDVVRNGGPSWPKHLPRCDGQFVIVEPLIKGCNDHHWTYRPARIIVGGSAINIRAIRHFVAV